jgi:MFS family permease
VFGLGNIVAAMAFIPMGLAADRWGGKRFMVGLWIASTLGAALFLPLTDWHGAFVGSILYWSGSAAFPLLSAHLASSTPRSRLGGELGIVYGAFFFGTIFASPFAGSVGAAFGLRAAIGLSVVAFALSTLSTLPLADIPPAKHADGPPLPRAFWTLMAVTPLAALIAVIVNPLFPVYVRDIAAVPLEQVGIFVGLVALGSALFSALNGRLADRLGPVPTIVGAGGVLTLGAALIALAGHSVPVLALGSLLLGSQTAANPVLVSALARVLPPARAGLGYTGFQLAYALGFGGGGLLSGVLYDSDPLLPLLVQIALAIPVTATVAVIVARVIRGRTAEAPS